MVSLFKFVKVLHLNYAITVCVSTLKFCTQKNVAVKTCAQVFDFAHESPNLRGNIAYSKQ